jgi:UPF0176 protein
MKSAVPIAADRILVRTFYRFAPQPSHHVAHLRDDLERLGREVGARGSVLLSQEGCNGTIAATPQAIEMLFALLRRSFPDLTGQDSWSDSLPFARWKVLRKEQIVAARDRELSPACNHSAQMSAQQWDEVREWVRRGQAQMLDVRNDYEVSIGTFPEARDPGTATFKEFSDFLDREVGHSLDPGLPTAIFCTGGIRCEKARVDLERRGFGQILQLQGGILGYLKEKPDGGFQGECFVFDERVALDRHLQPTRLYDRCPGCGDPWPRDEDAHDCRRRAQRPPV